MGDKYQDLPDIDHDTQDVFETSDIESDFEVTGAETARGNETEGDSADIDQSGLSVSKAKNRFSNDVLVGEIDVVNFSGAIGHQSLTRNGYKVTAVDETIDQKLSRIKRELEEIRILQGHEQIEENDVKNESDVKHVKNTQHDEDVKNTEHEAKDEHDVKDLVQLLEELRTNNDKHEELNYYNQRIKEIFSQIKIEPSTNDPQGTGENDRSDLSANGAEILQLESRLNTIETLVGSESLQELQRFMHGPQSKTIQNHLNDLSRKINIIYNPEFQLDKIKQEIRELNKETEKLATNRKLASITSGGSTNRADAGLQRANQSKNTFEQKVNGLFSRIDEFDRINAMVPSLLARLKSLHKVHADLGHTVSTVGSLDEVLNSMRTDMTKWNESIDKVNEDLDKQNEVFEANKREVLERLQLVTSKVDESKEGA